MASNYHPSAHFEANGYDLSSIMTRLKSSNTGLHQVAPLWRRYNTILMSKLMVGWRNAYGGFTFDHFGERGLLATHDLWEVGQLKLKLIGCL